MDRRKLYRDMENSTIQSNGHEPNKPNMSNKIKRVPHEGVFMSITKKAEKITTALYMLTDLIPENDPMRRRIREQSLLVMSDTRGVSYALTGDLYFHLAKIISKSWELVSLLEVSVVVGFISDMNYTIVKNALIDFIGDIRNKQRIEGFNNIKDMKIGEGEASNFSLRADFFKPNEAEVAEGAEWQMYEEKKLSVASVFEPTPVRSERSVATPKPVAPKLARMSLRTTTEPRTASPINEDRKQKILALVADKKDISIKDIVTYFREYSQKTVQRDLAALVDAGQLRRTGEKRWSRYSLV
jgi:DNA-binding transcriptional ArsR family regulator